MSDPGWSLHPQLAADTMPVGDLALSRLLAINAADYPWLVLVPRRAAAVELADLGADAFPLTAESWRLSGATAKLGAGMLIPEQIRSDVRRSAG